MVIVLLLSGYAIAATLGLVVVYRSGSNDFLDQEIVALARAEGSVSDRVNALKAIADIRRNDIRWFERAVSSIGVFTLITMTVATAVQTIRATVQKRELKEWELRICSGGAADSGGGPRHRVGCQQHYRSGEPSSSAVIGRKTGIAV